MKGLSFRQSEIVIVSGARTPFGKFCGAFSNLSATELAVVASKAAIERSGLEPQQINQTIFGNVVQSSQDAAYLARHVGLKSGLSIQSSALTVNRLCGSGMQAIIHAAVEIATGQAQAVLCGGTENMTQAPFPIWNARVGVGLGQQKVGDALWDALLDTHVGMMMGQTAEKLANQFSLTRQACDEFALLSQEKYQKAKARGFFKHELCPVLSKAADSMILDHDEHPRNTSLEKLSQLKPVFKGVVTAGNASGICDGACALVLASSDFAKQNSLPILGVIESFAITGVDPTVMGLGPKDACELALNRANMQLQDMDMIEINEAFSPQVLSVAQSMGINLDKLNINGGAIAMGHPLGASGARLVLSSLFALKEKQKEYALASACIGGGQGVAMIVKSV